MWLGVAQLVARDVWDVEVAGSSPVTQTIFVSTKTQKAGHWRLRRASPVFLLAPLKAEAGIAEAVAREGVFVGINVFNFFLEVFEVFVKNFGGNGGVFA